MNLVDISDELMDLSKEMIKTIELEDREYEFSKNKSYVERNIIASKFKKKLMDLYGLNTKQMVFSDKDNER